MPLSELRNRMWAEALDMLERAERLQRRFFELGREHCWLPPVDIFETEHDVWVIAALPGVPATRLQIQFDFDTLVIAGERPIPPALRLAAVHRLEIPHGRFERRIELPPGRHELDAWELRDGCLIVNLHKLY